MSSLNRLGRNLLLIGLAAYLASPLAQAQPAAGATVRPAEVVLIDASGTRLLGHGLVVGGKLALDLAEVTGRFVLLLVDDAGNVERLLGSRSPGGDLVLELVDGSSPTLAEFFASRGITLLLGSGGAGAADAPAGPGSQPGGGDDEDDGDDQDDQDDQDDDDDSDDDAGDVEDDDTDAGSETKPDDSGDDPADDADDADPADDPADDPGDGDDADDPGDLDDDDDDGDDDGDDDTAEAAAPAGAQAASALAELAA